MGELVEVCLSYRITYIIGVLLNLICVPLELIPLFFERIDPLFQLVQRTSCGLKFAVQRLQGLSLVDSEDIGIRFPVAELGGNWRVRPSDIQSPVFLQVLFTKRGTTLCGPTLFL